MTSFKKTPIQTFTKGSVVTNEEEKYWKQLGVSRRILYFAMSLNILIFRIKQLSKTTEQSITLILAPSHHITSR